MTAAPGGIIPIEPCAEAQAVADDVPGGAPPVEPAVEPRSDDPDDVEQEERQPTPHNPAGNPIAITLREGESPSAYDPTDPQALNVYGAAAFTDPAPGLIAEPEVTLNGSRVLVTWNKGAAMSADLGQTWQPINPLFYPIFANEDAGFCCDQLVRYVPQYDLWIWVAQYWWTEDGHNRIRLGVADGDAGFDARNFRFIDLIAHQSGFRDGVWFDRTNMATTDNYAFFAINAYSGDLATPEHHGGIVFRISLAELAGGGTIHPNCMFPPHYTYQTQDGGEGTYYLNAILPARGATDTMYMATHYDDSTLGVWRWPDTSLQPTLHWVRARSPAGGYIGYQGANYACPRDDGAGGDWCSRSDDRVLAGWLSNGQLGFAWNAGKDDRNPYPYLWSMLLDPSRLDDCVEGQCVIGLPSLGFKDRAIQYPQIAPNSNGDLGGVVLTGGGKYDLNCELIVHDGLTNANPSADTYWETALAAESMARPGKYAGDYLGIWPDGGGPRTWSGACMTVQNPGNVPTPTVHFLRFGRGANNPNP